MHSPWHHNDLLPKLIGTLTWSCKEAIKIKEHIYVLPHPGTLEWDWVRKQPKRRCLVCHPTGDITLPLAAIEETLVPVEPMNDVLFECLVNAHRQSAQNRDEARFVSGIYTRVSEDRWIQTGWRVAEWVPAGTPYLSVQRNWDPTLEVAPTGGVTLDLKQIRQEGTTDADA